MGFFKNFVRKLYSGATGAPRLVGAIAKGDAKDFKLFDDKSVKDSFKEASTGNAIALAAALGISQGQKINDKEMSLQNSGNGQELDGASGNPLANSTKGLKWTGIKQLGNKFFDAYGREILGKELDAILDKVKEQSANKPPKSGGTVFGGGSSVLNTQWQKLRIWVGNNWKILISVLVGAFVIWFFLFKRKSRTTTRRRRLTSRPVRRSGQSRNPSKRSKQLAALAKGRRTRMRNLRAKKRK